MLVKCGYRVELDLNNEQVAVCRQHAGAARWAYNYALTRKKENYQAELNPPYSAELHKEFNLLFRRNSRLWTDC